MYDISRKQQCWNNRLEKCIHDQGYTQTSFADTLNKKYGTEFTQKTISRWIHLGDPVKNAIRSFPEFDNMLCAAELLQVDIGYLLGETDAETFSLEKVCEYIGLSGESINAVKHITSPQSRFHFGHESDLFRKLLNSFLTSEGFVPLMDAFYSLDNFYFSMQHLNDKLNSKFTKNVIQEAWELYTGTTDYEHDATIPPRSPEIIDAINMIDDTISKKQELHYSIKVARYELNEAFVMLSNELFGKDKNSNFRK